MSDDSDFFGDVFDNPEDDPLLGDDGASAEDAPSSEEPERQGPPSWMEEPRSNGEASSHSAAENTRPEQKQIVVDQRDDGANGLQALNHAVDQGWRLVRLSLARPNGEQAASSQEAHRFLAVLEQDNPESLFDFG